MERKQVMRVNGMFDDTIVKVKGSKTCFTNDDYFKKEMHEDADNESYSSYPVHV